MKISHKLWVSWCQPQAEFIFKHMYQVVKFYWDLQMFAIELIKIVSIKRCMLFLHLCALLRLPIFPTSQIVRVVGFSHPPHHAWWGENVCVSGRGIYLWLTLTMSCAKRKSFLKCFFAVGKNSFARGTNSCTGRNKWHEIPVQEKIWRKKTLLFGRNIISQSQLLASTRELSVKFNYSRVPASTR